MKKRLKRREYFKLRKILFFVISLFLIPVDASLIINLPLLIKNYDKISLDVLSFIIGFLIFLMIFVVIGPPVKSYIVEHELGHIIFSLLTGKRIKDISFKKGQSYVKTSGINVFIALGPYFLPLYTVVLLIIYKILSVFWGINEIIRYIFYFGFGFTYSYHLIATIYYLGYDQPDLKRYGYFFSLIFLFTFFLIFTIVIAGLIFIFIDLKSYFVHCYRSLVDIFYMLLNVTKNF